jgi:hypothetical protein
MKPSYILALMLGCVFALSVYCEDGEKKVVKEEKVKVEKKDGESKEVKKEERKEEKRDDRGGSKFTSFWIHTVGGTIGNGLKKGANKIANTFD